MSYRIGEYNDLYIVKKVDFGVYLSSSPNNMEDKILLPAKQVPPDSKMGDCLRVFVYLDSEDRAIATTREPLLTKGKIAKLPVVATGKIGAFVYWGLEKDLLLPFKQQTRRVSKGDEVIVALYEDKSGRLCATMNIEKHLDKVTPYKVDEWVEGTVYEVIDSLGYLVAIDGKYSALLPKNDVPGKLKTGEDVKVRVAGIRDDDRTYVSIKDKAYLQIGPDGEKIMDMIADNGGYLPFTDKASPELISKETGMTKREFKRAIGHLLKKGQIEIKAERIIARE